MLRPSARRSGEPNHAPRRNCLGNGNKEKSRAHSGTCRFSRKFSGKAIWLLLMVLALAVTGPRVRVLESFAATEAPSVGGVLPEMSLPSPESPAASNYLGLAGKSSFKLPEIRAEVVIVEIFSMYCPYCQAEAPNVERLFQIIQAHKSLKDKVKLIGIGAGNTPYEVGVFHDRYEVPFPLFADPDFSIHKILGEVRTPYFIAIKINRDGSHQVIYSQLSSFGDPQDFLDLLLERAKIKEGA